MAAYAEVAAGDPLPPFVQRSAANPRYNIDTAAGRYLVLCFFGTSGVPEMRRAIDAAMARPDLFNDDHASFFGISSDPEDEARLANRLPGYRFLWDSDLRVSRLCGIAPREPDVRPLRPRWIITDPTMRVMAVIPFTQDGSSHARAIETVASLPPTDRFAGCLLQAPILYLPNVFEPEFCRTLIDLYDRQGGEVSGFMREVDGRTVGLNDPRHKSRRDVTIEDQALISAVQVRFRRRVVPEILKVHQFTVTRMERYMVGCYSAEEGGHFAAHRDNTTAGTAHRRFAVSVNLNDDFDGGEVSFPEYGRQGFKAPPGGAVVFSCSLLHAVSRVTRGRRYAFLPFLYDDAAAALRERNRHLIGEAKPPEPANAQISGG